MNSPDKIHMIFLIEIKGGYREVSFWKNGIVKGDRLKRKKIEML